MRLLALDVATCTGWASWFPGLSVPRFGERRFEGEIGQFACEFEDWLRDLLSKEAPDHVYLEAPITKTRNTNLSTTMRLIGGQVVAYKLCYAFAVSATAVPVSSWRKAFIGRAVAPKTIAKSARRKWLKCEVVSECRRRGIDVQSDDAGDAIGLLSFAMERNGEMMRKYEYGNRLWLGSIEGSCGLRDDATPPGSEARKGDSGGGR